MLPYSWSSRRHEQIAFSTAPLITESELIVRDNFPKLAVKARRPALISAPVTPQSTWAAPLKERQAFGAYAKVGGAGRPDRSIITKPSRFSRATIRSTP